MECGRERRRNCSGKNICENTGDEYQTGSAVLRLIENEIGNQLEKNGESQLTLDIEEAEVVMSFVIESLFFEAGAVLSQHPRVSMEFIKPDTIFFNAEVAMKKPLNTKIWISGSIEDDEGVPKLRDDLNIKVRGHMAVIALSAFGFERAVVEALSDLPGIIKRTLPDRLEKQGYRTDIGKVRILFSDYQVISEIQ